MFRAGKNDHHRGVARVGAASDSAPSGGPDTGGPRARECQERQPPATRRCGRGSATSRTVRRLALMR